MVNSELTTWFKRRINTASTIFHAYTENFPSNSLCCSFPSPIRADGKGEYRDAALYKLKYILKSSIRRFIDKYSIEAALILAPYFSKIIAIGEGRNVTIENFTHWEPTPGESNALELLNLNAAATYAYTMDEYNAELETITNEFEKSPFISIPRLITLAQKNIKQQFKKKKIFLGI